jgi:hypothetical protein
MTKKKEKKRIEFERNIKEINIKEYERNMKENKAGGREDARM